jgi:hypothetical protein
MFIRSLLLTLLILLCAGCGKDDDVAIRLDSPIPGTSNKVHLIKRGGDATVGFSWHISIVPQSVQGDDGPGTICICDKTEDVAISVELKELIIFHNVNARFIKKETSFDDIKVTYRSK